jgi:hypothetical protein
MNRVSNMLREVAGELRKQGAENVEPKPLPNPTASLSTGDLGSLAAGPKTTGGEKSLVPKLPKIGV